MAEGGIVGLPQMTPIAREMAAMGRNGDTMLAHITPQEAMMLQRMGGSGTINPYTGLPEFFLDKFVKGIGKAVKGVGKGVKKFAKSTVGRAVTAIALGAFLGPAAAGFLGVSSAAGVAAVSGALDCHCRLCRGNRCRRLDRPRLYRVAVDDDCDCGTGWRPFAVLFLRSDPVDCRPVIHGCAALCRDGVLAGIAGHGSIDVCADRRCFGR